MTDSLMIELLQVVRDNPGITGDEVQLRFSSDHNRNTISGYLARLRTQGLIENRGKVRKSKWFSIENEEPDLEFLDTARWLIDEMKKIHPSERPAFLARHIQKLSSPI